MKESLMTWLKTKHVMMYFTDLLTAEESGLPDPSDNFNLVYKLFAGVLSCFFRPVPSLGVDLFMVT